MSLISAADFMELTRKTTPLAEVFGLDVRELEAGKARVRLPFRSDFMRAGGTVSGPAMMMLADYALYAVIMSAAENGAGAVTSNLNTTFLRRPKPFAVIADARLIRCGRRLAYGEVTMFSEGEEDEPVAHATGTYALPPEKTPQDQ
jgi:uncharacterized protein (TIGR00369 family)